MIASAQRHGVTRPALTGAPRVYASFDATARGVFWTSVTASPGGVDAATAALRERIRAASPFARLSGMLRLAR